MCSRLIAPQPGSAQPGEGEDPQGGRLRPPEEASPTPPPQGAATAAHHSSRGDRGWAPVGVSPTAAQPTEHLTRQGNSTRQARAAHSTAGNREDGRPAPKRNPRRAARGGTGAGEPPQVPPFIPSPLHMTRLRCLCAQGCNRGCRSMMAASLIASRSR